MSILVTDASGNHALAVVRSLGGRGLDVIAAGGESIAQAGFSRYCSARVLYPSPRRGLKPFQDALLGLLDERRPRLLMPMTECTLVAIAPIREEIESSVVLAPLPETQALAVAFDKRATLALADGLGVRAPETFVVHDLADLDDLRDRITYPAVIKPRRSEFVTADGRVTEGGPVEYCPDAGRLRELYAAVHARAPFPLIQEFIPGEGFGVSVLYDHGRLRALFAHRRLRMIRPTGSGSSLRESIAPPEDMVAPARRLLESLGWHGVAMVEFKRDARDGAAVLMEINGRFWNSLPLAIASGVDFPFLIYRLATEGACPERLDYRVGVRGRWLAGDLRHLAAVLRGRPAGWSGPYPTRWRSLVDFVKPGGREVHYDDLWLQDPAPFVAGLLGGALRQLPARAAGPDRPIPGSPLTDRSS
ncbi:MAG TPA: ATP-grasp domain-containing protein [Patescibacteria group bacterium]|nr:ATP-grasp domain-containing protein [Patescibacteria group bacterium]